MRVEKSNELLKTLISMKRYYWRYAVTLDESRSLGQQIMSLSGSLPEIRPLKEIEG
jgi:hypothetical protein